MIAEKRGSELGVRRSPVTIAGISVSAVPERQNDYEHEYEHENEAFLRIRRWMLGVERWTLGVCFSLKAKVSVR